MGNENRDRNPEYEDIRNTKRRGYTSKLLRNIKDWMPSEDLQEVIDNLIAQIGVFGGAFSSAYIGAYNLNKYAGKSPTPLEITLAVTESVAPVLLGLALARYAIFRE